MAMSFAFTPMMHQGFTGDTFVSFDHADRAYRTALDCLAAGITGRDVGGSLVALADNSVRPGSIAADLAPAAIMEIIREKHLKKARTIVVLVGRDTAGRKFVDWEIAAALSRKCALHGVLLPSVPHALSDRYLPPRFRDNLESGYAHLCLWEDVFRDPDELFGVLYGIDDYHEETHGLIRNDRPLFKHNRPRRDATYREPPPPPRVDAPLPAGVAGRIRRLRKRAGLSPAEAAEIAGLPERDYDSLEHDDGWVNQCTLRELSRLADRFGVGMLGILDPDEAGWPDRVLTLADLRERLIDNSRMWHVLGDRWKFDRMYDDDWPERMPDYPLEFLRDAAYALVEDWRSFVPRSPYGTVLHVKT